MRKNKMMRLASGLLVAVLLTTSMISGTFAKYVASTEATDAARVAKFSVTALGDNNVDKSESDVATIDLFNQSKVYDEAADTKYGTETVDEDVANKLGDSAVVIAPGTWGKFDFNLANDSEVTVQYTLTYTATEANVPLEWSIDGTTWKDEITALNVEDKVLAMDTDEDVTIYWRWVFGDSANNTSDTALGEAVIKDGDTVTAASPSVKIAVLFEQVD